MEIKDLLPPAGTSPVAQDQLEDNAKKFIRCTTNAEDLAQLKVTCDKIEKIETTTKLYSRLEARTGLERWACAEIHYREADLDMLGCLANGDKVVGPYAVAHNLKTHNVPKGLGPWATFEDSAFDAIMAELKSKGWKRAPVGVADTIAFQERYNGMGPRNHGIDSGYVWGGTSEEDRGGYSSDGHWDGNRIEKRLGTVVIEKEMRRRELSAPPIPSPTPIEVPTTSASDAYQDLRILAAQSKCDLTPVEQLIEYHQKKQPNSKLRYWAVVDFNQNSKSKRLFLFDVVGGKFETHLAAHGAGSDPDADGNATKFSNVDGSHMSSLGIVKCSELYQSMGETRMRLDGLQDTNSKVRSRAIVMHSASYVNESKGTCGRSWGCVVVDHNVLPKLVNALHGGSLMNLWHS